MRILAFDLVYNGPSGWVLWDTEAQDPVSSYGEFQAKERRSLEGIERTIDVIDSIAVHIDKIVLRFLPKIIVFEESDWHNSLSGKGDWKKIYKRERIVQRTLGRAEATMIMATAIPRQEWGIKLRSLGANEARQEFGIKGGRNQKKRAAELFAIESTRFEFRPEEEEDWLFDTELNKLVSNHISDAFILAYVQARRENLAQLMEASA